MTAAISWSGGKDCCLALQRAKERGLDVRCLVSMFDETGERTRSHAVTPAVMRAQAEALGLELICPAASWSDYEEVFVDTLRMLRARGVTAMVFGDIDLPPHREWEEKVCAEAGVTPHLPLWLGDRAALAAEILRLGYAPIVVCTDDRWLDASFAGRRYTQAFLDSLPAGVDPCGENGEFHTFVADGPLFSHPVPVDVAAVESVDVPFGGRNYRYHYARLVLRA